MDAVALAWIAAGAPLIALAFAETVRILGQLADGQKGAPCPTRPTPPPAGPAAAEPDPAPATAAAVLRATLDRARDT